MMRLPLALALLFTALRCAVVVAVETNPEKDAAASNSIEHSSMRSPFVDHVFERHLTYAQCKGDCNYDWQCSGDLVCCQRNSGDPYPCCEGYDTAYSTDLCAPRSCCPLGACGGDCDKDDDCAGDLVCCQRDAGEPYPCCSGYDTSSSTDRCAPASCCRTPTAAPTTAPPTAAPTTAPPTTAAPVQPTPQPTTGPPTTAPPTEPSVNVDADVTVCFSEQATVEVLGKGVVTMKDLKVGDKILTAKNHYETVYAFGHYQPNQKADFLRIETDQKNSLEITADHLVYREGNRYPVNAASIQVGDRLPSLDSIIAADSNINNNMQTVTKISSVVRTGIYAPLTTSGTFLANGVKVSSYAALQRKRSENDETSEYAHFQDGTKFMPQHLGIHLVLTPYRWYCLTVQVCDSYNDNGMPEHVGKGIDVLQWMDQQTTFFQVVLFVPALLVFCGMAALEYMAFHCFGLLLLVTTVAALLAARWTSACWKRENKNGVYQYIEKKQV